MQLCDARSDGIAIHGGGVASTDGVVFVGDGLGGYYLESNNCFGPVCQ